MSEAETIDEQPTILDYLNEDCFRAVLEYVPVQDILRSERVSHRWQEVVLMFLRGVRFSIIHPYCCYGKKHIRNVLRLELSQIDYTALERWTSKLGPSVVATYCSTEESLKIFGENCPNLEAVEFVRLSEELLFNNQYENFKWLKRICFKRCRVSDHFVSRFLTKTSYALEELEFKGQCVTGQFLSNMKMKLNLKSLILNSCTHVDVHNFLAASAAGCFSGLVKLESIGNRSKSFYEINLLLDQLPKLEYLQIYFYARKYVGNLIESMCRLSQLKHLCMMVFGLKDEHVEAIARCCKELRSLELRNCCNVTARGLAAVHREAGARLRVLGVTADPHLTDDDVEACVRFCPNLKVLDVVGCGRLTDAAAARAAAARRALPAPRARLRLRLDGCLSPATEECEELILEFSDSLCW